MLKKWVKILPYFIVMKFTKQFSPSYIKTEELGDCRGWRISKGEWVLFSKDNYEKMRANELKRKKSKDDKVRRKLERKFNKNRHLKQQAEQIIEDEKQRRKESMDWD
jgi:hypothetical protein